MMEPLAASIVDLRVTFCSTGGGNAANVHSDRCQRIAAHFYDLVKDLKVDYDVTVLSSEATVRDGTLTYTFAPAPPPPNRRPPK